MRSLEKILNKVISAWVDTMLSMIADAEIFAKQQQHTKENMSSMRTRSSKNK